MTDISEIRVLDPATALPIASIEDMDEGYRRGGRPSPYRLRRRRLVRAQADRLARLESLDVGKPIAEAQGDVEEAARILEYAPSIVVHEPVWVVAAITP
jgi:hypothetical protein